MKRFAVVLTLALAVTAAAQTAQQTNQMFTSNLKQRADAPSVTDVNCSGYLSPEKYSRANYVAGGLHTPNAVRYSQREVVYLVGGGYTVGTTYRIIREVQDPNKYEIFPGQTKMVSESGHLYNDVALVKISYIEGETAVADVMMACEPAVIGDLVIPSQERPAVIFQPRSTPFQRFQPFDGGPSGRIVMGRDFDQFLGVGQKVYMNVGSGKGIKPGDYLRITRNYDPDTMAPIDEIAFNAKVVEDTQKDPAKVTRKEMKKLPYRGIGELIVLNVTDTTATGMITSSFEDVQPGDVVEIQKQR